MEGLRVLCCEDGVWHALTGLTGEERIQDVSCQCEATFASLAKKDRQLVSFDGRLLETDSAYTACVQALAEKAPQDRVFYYQHTKEENAALMSDALVNFVPHPKTMTMAGEWEYHAAGSQHPFPYALAELVDNSLRATRSNTGVRRIVISLVTEPGSGGMVSVWDNGCGMATTQLNQWAVMNLTMEDRGQQPQEAARGRLTQASGPTKQLCSDLSFFGVGSKNAAFFMGRCIKVSSKSRDHVYVHEMCIQAGQLEERYKTNPDDVYKERIRTRLLGADSNLEAQEQGFSVVWQWLGQEEEELPAQQPSGVNFTRVSVMDLKRDILAQLGDGGEGQVCRQLAHLYHYYLHGPEGNKHARPASSVLPSQAAGAENEAQQSNRALAQRMPAGTLPSGDLIPEIVVECYHRGNLMWSKDLRSVDDDMESRFLKGSKAEFPFTLTVPGKGVVEGVLWYFPYVNDTETVPKMDHPFVHAQLHVSTQARTQNGTQQTQRRSTPADAHSDDDGDDAAAPADACPIFETFWQGRLIPGSCVVSLPFIDAVRGKQSAADREAMPAESFGRIRGALFFGPSWTVTRNKLQLRDNIDPLLAAAVPDRGIEKLFRVWVANCHKNLDKTTRFERLLPAADQAKARRLFGDNLTVFGSMQDGLRTIEVGSELLCNSASYSVARVVYVGLNKVVSQPGPGSCGFAIVAPLPEAMWGPDALLKISLRRVAVPASAAELEEALAKEAAKLPSALVVASPGPFRCKEGNVTQLEIAAGRRLPEMTLEVVSSTGKKLSKSLTLQGKRHTLSITRSVFKLAADAPWPPALPAGPRQPLAKVRGGRKRKAPAASASDAGTSASDAPGASDGTAIDGADVVCEHEVQALKGNTYEFTALCDPLRRSGRYGAPLELGLVCTTACATTQGRA